MTARKTVQFTTKESVLQAYSDAGIINWALFSAKDLHFCYDEDDENEGYQMLEQTLNVLQNSAGIYTIRLYAKRDISEGGIYEKTAYKSCFSFRLQEHTPGYLPADVYRQTGGNYYDMVKELNDLRSKVAAQALVIQQQTETISELESEIDELDQSGQESGILGQIKPYIPQLIGRLVSSFGLPAVPPPAGRMGSVNSPAPYQDVAVQIQLAMQILCEAEPAFPDILIKLSNLAVSDKDRFLTYMLTVKGLL